MASRRVRIKGIANLPQRRKNAAADGEPEQINGLGVKLEETADIHNLKSCATTNCEEVKCYKTEEINIATEEKLEPSTEKITPVIRRRPIKPAISTNIINKLSIPKIEPSPQQPTELTHETDPPISKRDITPEREPVVNIVAKETIKLDESEAKKSVIPQSPVSIATNTQPTTTTENLPLPKKEFSSVIQRKCRRTEQSRKLATARRDFQMRFNNGHLDQQKLRMIDLLFYNPPTAPMSQKRKRRSDTESESIISSIDIEERDRATTPMADSPEKEQPTSVGSDEENAVPAPQITIGANGEIIVDEKSLVIENKDTIKNREALKKSELVDGDQTFYGMYKKVKRSKDWSKLETLRFYKALNTIGTDFTLMGELFPNRNRRELKMKFKKEERMNRNLVDRAITQPIDFDMTDLRKEVELEELERIEIERRNKELEECKVENGKQKRKKGRGQMGAFIQTRNTDDHTYGKIKKTKKKITKDIIKDGINSILDSDSDNSVSTMQSIRTKSDISLSDVESEEKAYKTQVTRSGRISKPTYYNEESNSSNSNISKSTNSDEKFAPGSIMILSEPDESGKTVYKIYTVDEEGNKIPIDLTPEILENLTQVDLC